MTSPSGGAFPDLVAALDPAMVVVTVAVADERDGCLVGFHSQCSIDPPRYAVWLSMANRTEELAQRATHLAVHLLGAGQHDLAELFGGETGDEVDKLARCAWAPGPGGVPLLDECPTRLVGRIVESSRSRGDHAMYLLAVEAAAVDDVPGALLHLSAATDIDPGHEAHERR